MRSGERARTAALQAEVVALRATVSQLRSELARVTAAADVTAAAAATAAAASAASPVQVAAAPVPVAAAESDVRWVTLQMPLVQVALGDPAEVASGPDVAAALASPDRGPDTAETEIVLAATPAPADRLAWSVLANLPERPLANLPERPLLDPRSDRDAEPRDPAATAPVAADTVEQRRTA